MIIAGMGVVCARGRGVSALEGALEQGWVPPVQAEVKALAGGRLPVYAVAAETLSDKTALAKARRADRFTRMAVLAAYDALQDSGLGGSLDRSRLGVIVGTALGPHVTTFSFLDGILDFGDAAVSPTAFSHAVHNAAASYIAMTLDVRGPTLTLTHFDFAFQEALRLAQAWLEQGQCDAVLVGAVDELGAVMQYACGCLLKPAADGRIKPFGFGAEPEVVPGEGSVFMVVRRGETGDGYARVESIANGRAGDGPFSADGVVHLLDTGGLVNNESAYLAAAIPGATIAGYAPLFGSIMTGAAFHAAVAALMLKRQRAFACPVQDNPHGVPIVAATGPAAVRQVRCTRLDCAGRCVEMVLERI